ncbi:MAG: hypothetical protein IPM54_13015 [Polyangiaceae bacterium]|nr:hypothetical protein [Polyangiaceae bacterium]
MHIAFVVHVVKGLDPEELLSDETKRETQAVLMSMEDAAKMGFSASGVQVKPGQEACLIVVAKRDAPWIARALEQHDKVAGFQQVDVNIG